MKTTYLATLLLLLGSLKLAAHSPDLSSTLLAESDNNTWVLQIRAALTAFEYEINNHYGKESFATPEEFQELVIDHVKESMSILYNGENDIILEKAKVKLGHETSVTFKVSGVPTSVNSLKVKNSTFSTISRNQSALIIVKKGFSKEQFVLNNKNNHTIELKLSDSKLVAMAASPQINNGSYKIIASSLLVISFFFFGFRFFKKPISLNFKI